VLTGQVRYTFRNFPLSSIHPQAQKAAEAAECAGEQGKYWEMHDTLFASQAEWSGQQDAVARFKALAADLKLDLSPFADCLDSGAYAARVASDQAEGLEAGVTGTPGFLINGVALSGAQSFAVFQENIEYYLAGGEPPTLEVSADSYRSLGRADAPVVVTEFSDYQCPACASVEQQIIPELIARYVDTGQVRFVYRQFPLSSIHPAAAKASEAAICAGKQGQYWPMHELLFARQGEWASSGGDPTSYLKGYAGQVGLDTLAFEQCLDSGEAAVVVKGDLLAGESLGVNATPYFFINDLPIRGGLPIDSLGRIIEYVAEGGSPPDILPRGADWHVRGNSQTARAISVAFVDYASPESAAHALEILPQLVATYVDSGQMLYVLHPWVEDRSSAGTQAAIAAECAGQQDRFWEMHDELFQEQETWATAAEPRTLFNDYALGLGLDATSFATCLDSDWARLRAQAGSVVGAMYGVPDAPVFLFNNGQGQMGSPTFEEFKTIIDSILGP
jgi:protein-disulfide isomerase